MGSAGPANKPTMDSLNMYDDMNLAIKCYMMYIYCDTQDLLGPLCSIPLGSISFIKCYMNVFAGWKIMQCTTWHRNNQEIHFYIQNKHDASKQVNDEIIKPLTNI